jgi:hypothetical protein
MNAYEQAVNDFRVEWLVKVVIACDGNMCAASRVTGAHRNTIERTLRAGGFTSGRLRQMVAAKQNAAARKPVIVVNYLGEEAERKLARL